MASSSTALMLAVCALLVDGGAAARMDAAGLVGRHRFGSSARAGPDCPGFVKENAKGDCIDAESQEVDQVCCDDVRECKAQVKQHVTTIQGRVGIYMGVCKVKQTDLVPKPDSTFEISNTANICSEACQDRPELAEVPAIPVDALRAQCGGEDAFESLMRMMSLVRALDTAWKACKTPETTSSTTPEAATAEEDLFEPVIDTSSTVFVIDRSGSMERVVCRNGYNYNRYDFAVVELTKAIFKMTEHQKFNIIVFDRVPQAMSEEPIPATRVNKEKMIQFMVTHGPREDFLGLWNAGATNIERALKLAYAMPGVDAVHLLSDGLASDGAETPEGILANVRRSGSSNTPLHTVLFMPGEDEELKLDVADLLKKLAEQTGGAFREPFPEMPAVCPERVGMQIEVKNAGVEAANGVWRQEGTKRGRPRYVKHVDGNFPWTGTDYIIEWSAGRSVWRMFTENILQYYRDTLYSSPVRSAIVPLYSWQAVDGAAPAPEVQPYLEWH